MLLTVIGMIGYKMCFSVVLCCSKISQPDMTYVHNLRSRTGSNFVLI